MKIEISIEKDGNDKEGMDKMDKPELDDMQKAAIGNKLKKNMTLTRMERSLLAQYLLDDKED